MPNDQAFLGSGWSFPPAFTAGGADVVMISGPDDIHQSLEVLFATRLGERVMQDTFGCDLHHVLFEDIDQGLINSLTSLISDAILYHEPRITLNRVDIAESTAQQGLVLIGIDYTIKSTNSRFNMVYPFYLNEAIPPGAA
jgi:phage baseplate assembly protein W